MKQLKINNTSTPYWCVVVEKNTFDFKVLPQMVEYWRGLKDKHEYWSTGEIKLPAGKFELLGCITSSGMDEGVREIDTMLAEHWAGICSHWKVNIMKLLTHNQITLTADQKAVVVKQIT